MRLRSRSAISVVLCLGLALSMALSIGGCRKEAPPADKAAQQQNAQQQWQDHVSEYTQGWVSTQTPLRIRFSHPVIKDAQLNKPLDGIVKLDPSQDVVAVFTADNVLEVRHPEPFASGKTFNVTLMPTHLQNLPQDMAPLSWEVRVLEQSMSVREIGLSAEAGNDDRMQLQGVIETTDNADNKAVEKILSAQQQDKALAIRWQHDDARTHKFTVEDIQRGDAASQLMLQWDGASISVATKGERSVEIPAARVFALTSARAVTQPDTYIELRFSQPLDARQNLTGLVRVNDSDARSQVDGAVLRVYPDAGNGRLEGEQQVHVDMALRSAQGKTLSQALDKTVAFVAELPAIRFAEKGNILPPAQRLTLPFEAVGVSAVQLRAFEVFPDNIGQYLQRNSFAYSGAGYINEYAHREVGRYLWQKTIQLPQVPHSRWQRFDLDVSELVASKKGSLLRLELQILPQFSVYTCDAPPPASDADKNDVAQQNYEGFDKSTPIPERLQRYYESEGYYDWSESKNPCSSSYYAPYRDHAHVAQMFFASNIGLLAKQGGDNTLHVVTTNLQSAAPMAGTDIKVLNYQQQVIGSGKTDADGMLTLKVEGVPFSVRADKDGDTNYLKVPRNEALPTGQFNTGGTVPSQGLKGFFYGERDIWRPGDDIYLTFILRDRDKTLPPNYPLTLEFFDPRGGKADSITNTKPLNGFYTFTLRTGDDAPTGNWRAIIKIGDNYFDQIVKVENIAPNRLKIELDVPDEGLHQDQLPLKTALHAQWLTGATASTLKADVQINLSATKTVFAGYEAYAFDDLARAFTSEPQKVFEGNLDEEGNARFDTQPTVSSAPPGLLAATFTQRVFEPGGQFSSQYRSLPFFAFKNWAGVKAPSGNADYYGALDKEADHAFDLLSVDSHGKTQPQRALTVQLYELEWSWWWDERQQNYAQYISNNMHALKETATVTTDGEGHAQWTLHGKKYDWGQYLVRVCDGVDSGVQQHCASTELYLGWGYGDKGGRDAATRMAVTSDKENYRVGDTASIRLPDGPDRRVLVSIENGSRVLQRYWQQISKDQNSFSVPITADMTPNVYVHVAQLQPHQQRSNDLPIRLYGILPLLVDDPTTHLAPAIKTVDKIRPQSTLKVEVSETQGVAMTYTLALVDEGLLGITDYSAPDPHKTLYQREALGVLTWDMFDQVVGAYSAELARLLAIGGGDSLKKRDSNRERRFPPIVRFLGAFELKAGETREHSIELPPYMGAVRVMVVAGDGHAYGRAEQSIKVTQPLTLLTTLPRVLGPGEELDVPVNVFATDELQAIDANGIGVANVGIVADDFFTVLKKDDAVSFDKAGEKLAHLRLKVNDRIGMATVTVAAALGSEKAQEVIHIPVRSANQPSTLTQTQLVQPGTSWTPDFAPHGMPGTNTTALTVSSMPELKLEQRLQYLISYPHGCIEQTTSAAFPQLYLPQLVELNTQQTLDVEQHVNAAIARLASFQTSSGGFAYWPYQSNVDPWANNYAGHFLLEAKQRGYSVPPTMLSNWQRYQRDQARSFSGYGYAADAYRVYTLALAGSADTGAMNRLRERLTTDNADETAFWLLALAYQQIGQDTVATELSDLLDQRRLAGKLFNGFNGWTYGSDLRDRSVLLLLQQKMGNTDTAWQIATRIAEELANDTWYSTQTTAWALLALAHSYGSRDEVATFAVQNGGATASWQNLASQKPIYRETLDQYQPDQLTVRNDSTHPLYVAISNRGVPANADEKARSKGLSLETRFTSIDGKPLAPNALKSGTDFIAEVTVTNTSDRELANIALTQVVPSGWQIRNTRLEGMKENADIDYQHVGDDRLVSYFALRSPRGSGNSNFYWWRDNRQLPNSVTVKMLLNASFAGRFYLPGWQAEPMYDAQFSAASVGQWVDVE